MHTMITYLFGCFLCLSLPACVTSSQELLWQRQAQARPHAASLGNDYFFHEIPYRADNQKVSPDEFFFKKCQIKEKRTYPSRHLWECEGGF